MKPADVCIAVMVAVIWGLAFVASRIALDEFSPELMTTLRFAIAALPCLFLRKPGVSWLLLIAISFTLFLGQFLAQAFAIAHGVPVVGTNAGAIPETVPPGAGVLVPPDDIEALAAALRRLIDLGIRHGGSYYPTYHKYATRKQVETCYPQFAEFLKLKRKYDPGEVFQSDWYRHYVKMFS